MNPTSGTSTTETTQSGTLAASTANAPGSQESSRYTGGSASSTPNTGSNGAVNSTSTTNANASALTDDQILYVLHAGNLGEMDQARVAQKKAKNVRVKHFAAMMLQDHSEADTKGNEVAKKVRASLAPSEVSNRLETDAKDFSTRISAEKGNDFDRTYMDAQVKEHRALLDSIDRDLLPSVKSDEVKTFVQTIRAKVQSHLQEAEDIQKGLGAK
jgi:putative membrane protein